MVTTCCTWGCRPLTSSSLAEQVRSPVRTDAGEGWAAGARHLGGLVRGLVRRVVVQRRYLAGAAHPTCEASGWRWDHGRRRCSQVDDQVGGSGAL